jgi:predicted Zn-dependent protease
MGAMTISSTNYLKKPFYITLDERLSREDKNIIINNLERLLIWYERLAGVKIPRYYFDRPWCRDPNQPYCRPNYYIEMCRDSNDKINANCILNLIRTEPWQQHRPHIDVFVIDDIIYTPGTNFLFGLSFPAIFSDGKIFRDATGVVLSVGILKLFYGRDWPTAFYGIEAHELGHLFGLPNPKSPYYIGYNHPRAKESPLYANHCSYKYCIMRQVNAGGSLDIDLLDLTRDILKYNPNLYCDYDRRLLIRNLQILFG